MTPFVLSRPNHAPAVAPRSWSAADYEFFALRNIDIREGERLDLPTTSPVTKSTETTIPATDSDEKTWNTIDD